MEKKQQITISGNKLYGFLWRSDNSPHEVEIFNGTQKKIDLDASNNPFVVEGQLYDEDNGKSYSIKYMDGGYLLNEYNVKALLEEKIRKEDIDIREYQYIAAFDKAPGLLHFKEFWREDEEDKQCLPFKPLCPAEFVFVGFSKFEMSYDTCTI